MYLFGARLVLADRLGVLPASASCPVASCGAAFSGSGLWGVLATSAYVLADCSGVLTASASCPVASSGAALSGSGLVGILA